MLEQSFRAGAYVPTTPRSGSEGQASIFRGSNFLLKGRNGEFYMEMMRSPLDLSEPIPTLALTGTVALVADSTTVVGTGTSFLAELRTGQLFLAGDFLCVVDAVVDQTHLTIGRAPDSNSSGLTGERLPVIFALNQSRGTLIRGNAKIFDKGNILGVGAGNLRINGQLLNANFAADPKANLAVYDPSTGIYTVYQLGMDTPVGVTATEVAGGVQNMQVGNYSIVLVPSRTATGGYNNPSNVAEVSITIAGNRIAISAPAMDTVNGQDAWDYYGTYYATQPSSAIQGPWYFVGQVTAATLGTTGATTFNVEWRDAQLSFADILTYNNDAPVDAGYVATLTGYPIYVSCQGQGYSSSVTATSPGPLIVPAKPTNVEAAPLDQAVPLSPPETILGFVEALARLYLLTPNHLQFANFTGIDAFPVTARAFWKTGFKGSNQLIFVNGTLYGYPVSGPTRSTSDAEEAVEEHAFAADVVEIIKNWIPNHVLVAHDPKNNAVCFFHSADSLNDSGYWTTTVLMYMLAEQVWSPLYTLTSETHDMIVCSVTTVGENLEFLAGGRTSATTEINTYRWDAGSDPISGYVAWQYQDSGSEMRPKVIDYARVTARSQGSTIGIHGASPGEAIDVDALEAGNSGSKSGSIPVPDSTEVFYNKYEPMKVKNLGVWTVRYDAEWDGTGDPPRVDEVVCNLHVEGAKR